MAYWLLFISALGSATLLPMQSEAVLTGMLLSKDYHHGLLILCAGLGNVLGSCINFWLGQKIDTMADKQWFPFSHQTLNNAKKIYGKYGYWSLFASWVPVVGDPLTLLAGVLGERFWRFLLIVIISKFGRYIAIDAVIAMYH